MGRRAAHSPLDGFGITGYLDRLAVDAGTRVELMASGPGGVAALSLERLRSADPDLPVSGAAALPVQWGQPTSIHLDERVLALGSFMCVPPAAHLLPEGSFAVELWVLPTLRPRAWSALAAQWAPADVRFGIFQTSDGTVTAAVSQDGRRCCWVTLRTTLELGRWQQLRLDWDAITGRVSLRRGAMSDPQAEVRERSCAPGPLHASSAPICFGARSADGTPATAADHFDGRLARPILWGEDEEPLGSWELSQDVGTATVPDSSHHRHPATLVNAPMRATTGPGWQGRPSARYSDDPSHYDSVHLHSDDLDDANWPATVSIDVPDTAEGVHAITLRNDAGDSASWPFVVRPRSPRQPCAVLLPTLTWRAYAGNRRNFSWTEDGVLDAGLCLYDLHADGSLVTLTSCHRPTRSGTPFGGFANWGPHLLTADLYLIDWLEHEAIGYDVLADEHLDAEGLAAISSYRCLILGAHPEYATAAMLDALEQYLAQGGRLIYPGGNGLYWVTSIDRRRPHLIEVRKSSPGEFPEDGAPAPGESQHQTTLEPGGLWEVQGRPPSRIVGLAHSANRHDPVAAGAGYVRTAEGRDSRWAWVFDGVADEPFGETALTLGHAAGYEMDVVPERLPGDLLSETVRLARARDSSFFGLRRLNLEIASDLAIGLAPNGGAVFSAGSVSWGSALSADGYRGPVGTITGNVLRRMLDTPAGTAIA